MKYEQARYCRVGDFVRLDIGPFNDDMIKCLSAMISEKNLISGLEYQIKGIENHNTKDPFIVFEIENNKGEKVKLGSHLFNK